MQLPGPLRNIMRGNRADKPPAAPVNSVSGRTAYPPRNAASAESVGLRQSRGLEEFFSYIRDQSGLTILDLGGATQENVSFITNLGHRLYSEDFLQILNETFGANDTVDQSNPGRIEYFLRQALEYPEDHFDGVLVWDVLEYLAPALLTAVVERLCKIVRPKSYMLSFFQSDDKLDVVPFYTFRIQEVNVLQVSQQGMHRPAQLFNNRGVEKLFGQCESVKFFLTRERLREVIIKV
jgi:hypothetical protein